MDAVNSEAKRRNQLPDLDSLDGASLKALVLAKHTEIENLNLLALKLKRMHVGQRSEKISPDSGQLELRLEGRTSGWLALMVFVDDGRVELDNNAAERALRTVA